MKLSRKLSLIVIAFISLLFLKHVPVCAATPDINVKYQAHVQRLGWQAQVKTNDIAGTTGQGLRLEALKVNIDTSLPNVKIKYRTHVQREGWQPYVYNGQASGTTGQGLRVEAIQMQLEGAPNGYHVQYQVHVQGKGWTDWVEDGQIAGTTGQFLRLEAVKIKIVKGNPKFDVKYQAHVQREGWQAQVKNNDIAGTTGQGLRLEALKVNIDTSLPNIKIKYRTHVQREGWQPYVYNGQASGTTGQGLRVEAIQVQLEGAPEGYHVQYQAHVQGKGWMDWVQDGKMAGTTGQSLRLEAIRIKIVKYPPLIFIDSPKSNFIMQNDLEIKGWALNVSKVKQVNILLDGQVKGKTTIGIARPDVNKAHPGYPNGANSGFRYILKFNSVVVGTHKLTVQAVGYDGTTIQESVYFKKGNAYVGYTNYPLTLNEMLDIQIKVGGQTDKTGKWTIASKDDISKYLDSNNYLDDYGIYQFLKLNSAEGITANDLNKLLVGKGVLQGKGSVFLKAATENNISPVYLISHALLETGNGTSTLSKGIEVKLINKLKIVEDKDKSGKIIGKHVEVNSQPTIVENPRKAYNVFGIHAFDYLPVELKSAEVFASEYAYSQNWYSIDDAIIGGAKWIANQYINSSTYKQDTLYKMRWNPDKPGTHQYASDVAWAYKQISNIKKLIDQCPNAKLTFDIPRYR